MIRRLFLAALILFMPLQVLAISQKDNAAVNNDTVFYDSTDGCNTNANAVTGASGDIIVRFLQALAYQENGGKPTGTSGTGARGKFQYIDSTWHSSAKAYYPPADQYATANDAPEAVQDAVAYLEYAHKYNDLGGDIFKMAVSHFYPAALTDASKMDIVPSGNSITPREYGNSVLNYFNNGTGKDIVFHYQDAPDFAKYAAEAGAPADATPAPTSSASAPAGTKAVVVLDPGHSGTDIQVTDPTTGILDHDYPTTTPEMGDVFAIAQTVKQKLEADGYTVVMTKNSENDTVSLRQRATIASQAGAAIAVSIHNDYSQDFGSFAQIYAQVVGGYREKPDGTKVTFDNQGVAAKSQQFSSIFAQERSAAEGRPATVTVNSFDGRPGIAPGNLPLVELFATVPWVYNEVGGNGFDANKYAQGIIGGIEKSVPATGTGAATGNDCADGGGGGVVAGSIVQTALNLAWHTSGHGPLEGDATPAYQEAMPKYNGSTGENPFSDCGVFVSTVMIASGADPSYVKRGTTSQMPYLEGHPDLYQSLGTPQSTSELQPGDILINSDHTYLYVGPQPEGFNAVSASLNGHVPESNSFYQNSANPFKGYRKK